MFTDRRADRRGWVVVSSAHGDFCQACGKKLDTKQVIVGDVDAALFDVATGIYERPDGSACLIADETMVSVFVHAEGNA
jgi:hypothetical protein